MLLSGEDYSEVLARRRRQRAAQWTQYELEQERQAAVERLYQQILAASWQVQKAEYWLARLPSIPQAARAA